MGRYAYLAALRLLAVRRDAYDPSQPRDRAGMFGRGAPAVLGGAALGAGVGGTITGIGDWQRATAGNEQATRRLRQITSAARAKASQITDPDLAFRAARAISEAENKIPYPWVQEEMARRAGLRGVPRGLRHGALYGAGAGAALYGLSRLARRRDYDPNQPRDKGRFSAGGAAGAATGGAVLGAGAGGDMGWRIGSARGMRAARQFAARHELRSSEQAAAWGRHLQDLARQDPQSFLANKNRYMAAGADLSARMEASRAAGIRRLKAAGSAGGIRQGIMRGGAVGAGIGLGYYGLSQLAKKDAIGPDELADYNRYAYSQLHGTKGPGGHMKTPPRAWTTRSPAGFAGGLGLATLGLSGYAMHRSAMAKKREQIAALEEARHPTTMGRSLANRRWHPQGMSQDAAPQDRDNWGRFAGGGAKPNAEQALGRQAIHTRNHNRAFTAGLIATLPVGGIGAIPAMIGEGKRYQKRMAKPLNERQAQWVAKRMSKAGGIPISSRYMAERAFGGRQDSPADRYAAATQRGNEARATRIASRHPYVVAPPEMRDRLRARERGIPTGAAIAGGAGLVGVPAAAAGAAAGGYLAREQGNAIARLRTMSEYVPSGTNPQLGDLKPVPGNYQFEKLRNSLLPDQDRYAAHAWDWRRIQPGAPDEVRLFQKEGEWASKALANPQVRAATQARMARYALRGGLAAGGAGLALGGAAALAGRTGKRRDAFPPRFEESKHNRAPDGKFAGKGGGGGGGGAAPRPRLGARPRKRVSPGLMAAVSGAGGALGMRLSGVRSPIGIGAGALGGAIGGLWAARSNNKKVPGATPPKPAAPKPAAPVPTRSASTERLYREAQAAARPSAGAPFGRDIDGQAFQSAKAAQGYLSGMSGEVPQKPKKKRTALKMGLAVGAGAGLGALALRTGQGDRFMRWSEALL